LAHPEVGQFRFSFHEITTADGSIRPTGIWNIIIIVHYPMDTLYISKVVPNLITSVGHGADPGFLAVSLQVTLIINPVVGYH